MADVDDDSQVNHVEIIVEKQLTYVIALARFP